MSAETSARRSGRSSAAAAVPDKPEKAAPKKAADKTPKAAKGPSVDWLGWVKNGDAEEAEATITWVGDATSTDDSGKHYGGILYNDKAINLGECVYLRSGEEDLPCEIGQINDLFEGTDGKKMVVTWFWRQEHIEEIPNKHKPADPKEIFLSETSDENAIDAIERTCSVVYLPEGTKPDKGLLQGNHKFYYRKLYDPASNSFAPASKKAKEDKGKRKKAAADEDEEVKPKKKAGRPAAADKPSTADTAEAAIKDYRVENEKRLAVLDTGVAGIRYEILESRNMMMERLNKMESQLQAFLDAQKTS